MADKKQLGTQYLNTATVKKNIEEVNAMLKNLGKGVDLDLTKIVNTKVNTQLNNLKRQIQEIGQATSQASKVSTNELKEATKLLKEQIQLEAKLATTTGKNARAELTNQIESRRNAYNQLSEAARTAAQTTTQIAKAQDQLNQSMAKAKDQAIIANRRFENSLLKERLALYKQELREQEQFARNVGNQIVTRAGMAILNELKSQWSAMVDYATTYYDTLNEIRVVTGMTEQQANEIGTQYRQQAKEMKVTSTELSSAAVTFYRQGLNDSQVNSRLEWVTKYAKVANISFETAAEQITASANAMSEDIQGDIERVVDVFLYLGDAAATSGEEIGVAMQKASASATEFGLSFEWLGTYIATVSEQTRQAPQTIGNAFNSMMARLHSIKQNGFNEEDETKINDVAKALANVNIALMDSDGNWRDMSDIFTDISKQWGTMTDKQKSYIATTLAGTRQQNVFFALMNDMSKGIEGGSRAWELYTGALESAGTATEKFAVWQESIAASQENLSRAFEDLYASLQPGLIKSFTDALAWLVEGLSKLGSLGTVIPIVAAAIGTLILTLSKFGQQTITLAGILESTKAAFLSHPIFLFASLAVGAVALTGAIGGLLNSLGAFKSSAEMLEDATQAIAEANEQIDRYAGLQSALYGRFAELAGKTELTTSEQKEYNNLLQEFSGISVSAKSAVDNQTSGLIDQATAAGIINEELETLIGYEKTIAQSNALKAISNWQKPDEWSKHRNDMESQNIQDAMAPYGYNGTSGGLEAAIQTYVGSFNTKSMYNLEQEWWDENNQLTALGKFFDILDKASRELGFGEALFQGMDNFDQWPLLASYVYQLLVGSDKQISDFQSELEKSADELIDYALTASNNQYGDIYQGLLAEYYKKAIMGEDGILSQEDFDDVKTVLQTAINEWLEQGLDLFSNDEIMYHIFDSIFGEGSSAEMDHALSRLAEDGDAVHNIANAYAALLKAGFSNVDIASLFTDAGVQEWSNIIAYAQQQFEIPSDFWEELFFDDGQGIDQETDAQIQRFLMLGGTIEEVQQHFADSKGLEDFKKRLNGIVEESTNVQDSIDKDIDYVKEITSALSEVDKVTSILDDLHEGKAIKLTDLLGLAEAHPELLAVMDDMEELESALNDLVDSDNENVSSLLRGWAANNEATAQRSPFVDMLSESVTTLEELRAVASANGDLELLASIDEYLDKIVHNAIAASEEMSKPDWKKGISDSIAELEQVDDLIKRLSEGESLAPEDIFNITESHPHLLMLVDDMGAFLEELKNMRSELQEAKKEAWLDYVMNDPTMFAMSGYNSDGESPYATFAEAMAGINESLDFDGEEKATMIAAITAEAERLAAAQMGITDAGEDAEAVLSDLGRAQQRYERNEKIRQAIEDIDPTSKNYSPGKAAQAYEYLNSQYVSLKNFDRSTEEGRLQYLAEATKMLEIETEQINAEAEAQGIVSEATAEAARKNQEYVESLQELRDEIEKSLELNRAQQEGYAAQFEAIDSALQSGGMEAAVEAWKSISPDIQAAIQKDYPQLVKILTDAELKTGDLANETAALQKELSSGKFNASTRYFTNTAKAIQSLTKYETTAADAMATFNSEAENAVKAQAEYREASVKLSKGTEVAAEDVQNLATFLGFITPDALLDSWDQVGPMLSAALAEGEEAQNRLNEAAFINITGTSSADFSEIQNGLIATQGMAEDTVNALLATGQWTTETLELNTDAWVQVGKKWELRHLTGTQQILKPTGNNPFRSRGSAAPKTTSGGSSGGGGGGGGGGSKQNTGPSEIEIMLDRMSQIQSLQSHTRSLYSAQAGYYSQTGELQGVIRYYEKEIDAIKQQNKTLEDNVSELAVWIEKKKAEVNALDKSTDEYSNAADELKQLQDRHQDYTTQQINNRTEVDKLTKSIKAQKDAIRDMEIDLRNTILQAIEDREALNERMLQGQINLENEILSIIQARYEKERDLILTNAQEQIDSLQKERDLLDEQLQLRKEQAEQEEKAAKLAELEAKYARISADPTRKKEMLSIEKQIKDLRKEMAWDLAEKEVEAQKEVIDEQITSIEDYKQYVEDYYDDQFEHPKKQIDEMKTIIVKTDEEIIAWLKKNSSDYEDHTEATQQNVVKGWQDMIDDMHGRIKTYWDEVESIIEQGDDAIIEFLKENSADYKAAGKLQADAYVDEWLDKLEKLKLAYQQVTGDITSFDYSVVAPSSGGGSNSGGGSGGGGSDTGSQPKTPVFLRYDYNDKDGTYHTKWPIYSDGPHQSVLEEHNRLKKVDTGATVTCYCSLCGHYMGVEYKTTTTTNSTSTNRSGGCFVAGTQIIMADHTTKNIEDVRIGEMVIAYNDHKKIFEQRMVTKSYVHHNTPRVLSVVLSNGIVLGITPGHPVLTVNGWKSRDIENSLYEHGVSASWLEIGDQLVGCYDNVYVVSISEQEIPEHYDTYNIEVETCHTYVVEGIVVHNAKLEAFGSGGLADYTGPAWLDGTPDRPERILSPYQTALFDNLVATLENMNRVFIPSMPSVDNDIFNKDNSVTVGDIIVNVEKMEDDADYEQMAEKVFTHIMNRLNRGSVVGGIRLTR